MMKRSIKNRIYPCLPAIVLLLCAGCVKREMDYRKAEGYVEITLKWSDKPYPAAARVIFYNEDGTLYQEYDQLTDGFKGVLPAGKYRVVIHNTDAQQVAYRGMESYSTAEVYALEQLPAQRTKADNADEPCITEPQLVYGTGGCDGIELLDVVQGDTLRTVSCPVALTKQVKFRFDVNNTSEVKSLSGFLTGVSPSVLLATGEPNTTSCSVAFTTSTTESNQYTTSVRVFDIHTRENSAPGTNTLRLDLTDQAGDPHRLDVDITQAVEEIVKENEGVIPVEIPIKIELTLIGKDFHATVEPWDNSGGGSGTVQ